jgi:hypothetical protein
VSQLHAKEVDHSQEIIQELSKALANLSHHHPTATAFLGDAICSAVFSVLLRIESLDECEILWIFRLIDGIFEESKSPRFNFSQIIRFGSIFQFTDTVNGCPKFQIPRVQLPFIEVLFDSSLAQGTLLVLLSIAPENRSKVTINLAMVCQ